MDKESTDDVMLLMLISWLAVPLPHPPLKVIIRVQKVN